MNIRLTIAYDGKEYLGWQKTRCKQGVEDALRAALKKILGFSPQLQAASRTDAGVHAQCQVVNFFAKPKLSLEDISYRMNRLLPKSLVILKIEQASETFHPSLDCRKKTYRYTLQTSDVDPLERHIIWHYPYPIDLKKAKRACQMLIGQRDFKAFENVSASPSATTICEIFSINIAEIKPYKYHIDITGDRFLYKMARTLVGTIADIGSGKLAPDAASMLLTSKDRAHAGVTAPAHGLMLLTLHY